MSQDSETRKTIGSKNRARVSQVIAVLVDKYGGKKQLAKVLGKSDGSVHSWLQGTEPKVGVYADIIAATGCDPGWLLTGRGEPFPTVADTPKTAAAMEDAFVSLIRQAGHSADAVVAIEPFVGRESIRQKITPAEIRAAARSLRDAGGQLLGLAGPPGEDE